MGMVAILFNSEKPFEQIVSTTLTEGPIVKSGENWKAVSEKKTFEGLYDFIHI